MATYLDRILEAHRLRVASDTRPLDALISEARLCQPQRGFRAALTGDDHICVISEIKRRSPSKPNLNPDLDPAALAVAYKNGGASCISVLTDSEFFGGSVADLQTARNACDLPVIRKDFTMSAHDVADARIIGADCVLLIAAALPRTLLVELHSLATSIGLDVLVEIHDEAELEAALAANATMIGVNQRDLVTFQVDHDRALRMAGVIPDHVVKVAESGVRGPADARALHTAGYQAILVGEVLVTSLNPSAAVAELIA